jgi:hypothetical protein
MNQRAEYLLQVLEKLGTPLMASIMQAPGRLATDDVHKDAQRMAELLAKTTQASIEMSRAIDFGSAADGGDSLRVALAALASGLIGTYYKHSGKPPADNDLKKMSAALQTVLAYSENFMPGADAAVRMENLQAKGQPVDPQQTGLQYIHAFVPVVNAVTSFPFGQPEQKLIMDVASKLVQRAMEMRESLFPNAAPADQKRIELSILGVLTNIYAACHDAETARLMSLTEEQRTMAGLGMDTVWKNFELRIGIVEALSRTLVPGSGQAAGGGASKGPAPAQQQAAPPPPPAAAPPVYTQAPVQPVQPPPQQAPPVFQQPAPPPQAAPPAGNPMSMFSKKPEGDDQSPPPAAPPPYTPPPAAGQPANPPPAQDSGNSPMGFFKKKE